MSKPMSPEEAAELERDCVLDPEPVEPAEAAPAAGKPRRAQRLRPLPGPFNRVPLQWHRQPHKPCPFDYKGRLFLELLYRSHYGQKEVRATNELAAEIGVPERAKRRCLAQLARDGWVRVVRREEPSHTIVVIVLVHNAG
jgi:hypothetical protein